MLRLSLALSCCLAASDFQLEPHDHSEVRGITISCQTNGREWGTPEFAAELEELAGLGANWIAIHPYARIHADGHVTWAELDPTDPPEHIAGPIDVAHERGLSILIKPHLAYWGSPFSWRGEIEFDDARALVTFRESYRAWTLELATVCANADGFVVGCELDGFQGRRDEVFWRELIAEVRARTDAHLTYAASWSSFEDVRFWDALDCIGVQAYFPLSKREREFTGTAGAERLRKGWAPWLRKLRALHERSGKPVVFTELGYDANASAVVEPWTGGGHGRRRAEPEASHLALQELCLDVALEVLAENREWLRGALLWKWFVGAAPGEDFVLDRVAVRELIERRWVRGRGGY